MASAGLVEGGVAGPAPEHAALGPGEREAGHPAAGADAGALEVQGGLRDHPAVALAADEVGVVDDRLVEEDLVEDVVAGHLPQRPDGDAGLVELEGEPRDALVLGHVEARAGEQHPVVAAPGLRRPHLLTADDPPVAVALGPGGEPGEVGAGAGLAEELGPAELALEDRRDVAGDLVGVALGEDRGRRHQEAEAAGRSQGAVLGEAPAHHGLRSDAQAAAALLGREVRGRPAGGARPSSTTRRR